MQTAPRVILILSTMRSGSTLLKALLGQADDVSHLPEVNFQRLARRGSLIDQARPLADEPILVLKRPAWFHEAGRYPRLPADSDYRVVALVRDAYPTVQSLRKMTFGPLANLMAPLTNRWLVRRYWARVTQRLLDCVDQFGDRAHLIRYEDLVAEPLEQTAQLFSFVGSQRTEGVDTYTRGKLDWKWGRDDGSEQIRSLKVQPPRALQYKDQTLVRAIESCPAAAKIRQQLGYAEMRPPA